MALAISFTFMSGRHGFPSLKISIFLLTMAQATKSFNTRSNLRRVLKPQAVANLKQVTANELPAIFFNSISAFTFDRAYAVRGFTWELSFRGCVSARPYTLQL